MIAALAEAPHSGADVGQISTQAVYDVLNTLTERGLVRRIQPAGSIAHYELRVGETPCLDPSELDEHAPGFMVDEAEVT